ncbi:hypothetical protein GCM10010187_41870 [Actinomadura coerulea]|nr:hypothetical protein GCM10010187_41870 [Actinomadura coerulea]
MLLGLGGASGELECGGAQTVVIDVAAAIVVAALQPVQESEAACELPIHLQAPADDPERLLVSQAVKAQAMAEEPVAFRSNGLPRARPAEWCTNSPCDPRLGDPRPPYPFRAAARTYFSASTGRRRSRGFGAAPPPRRAEEP